MFSKIRGLFLLLICFSFAASAIQGEAVAGGAGNRWVNVVGTEKGLFGLSKDGAATPLWMDGAVRKILKTDTEYLLLSDRGIFASTDLASFASRNEGLPVKVLKRYDGTRKSFDRVVQEIKDIEVDPRDTATTVCAVKDAVYLSRDSGRTWRNLGTPVRTNGIKAVAIASFPQTVVFVSHAIYGVHYLEADKKGAAWTELNDGLAVLETTENPDEIADLHVAVGVDGAPTVWASQTFKARVYRLDWTAKAFSTVWADTGDFGTIDSLSLVSAPGAGTAVVRFVGDEGIGELRLPADRAPAVEERPELNAFVRRTAKTLGSSVLCLLGPGTSAAAAGGAAGNGARGDGALSELWLVPGSAPSADARKESARGKQGLYLPVNHALDAKSLAPYLKTIEERGLDMVVIDMKDDYGRLRFTPRDASIAAKGRVFNPVDIDSLISTMKARGVWLAARIVVFKDPTLAAWGGGKYAVWDQAANAPWQGYYTAKVPVAPPAPAASAGVVQAAPPAAPGNVAPPAAQASGAASATTAVPVAPPATELVRKYYDEKWVDPYSEDVWSYTVGICRELAARGFDEIQFDYIRFPTDGENLGDARYRWRDAGMDMESAILSFLSYARANIEVPISIDIYGANGWYRTGARTGQEVELLSRYVDVICPMYYPSHFEQNFLANDPPEQRPYRIYYRGSLRTERIARGRIVVRPYVQSFYLNVAYDRKYYGPEYVLRQVEGVRDAGGNGLTYWNNVGRYDEIPMPETVRTVRADDASKERLD